MHMDGICLMLVLSEDREKVEGDFFGVCAYDE